VGGVLMVGSGFASAHTTRPWLQRIDPSATIHQDRKTLASLLPTLKEQASRPMNPSINQALRLITLWIAWLLAMLFHVDLGLMPLFHGQSPEIHSHVQEGALPLLFGAMLGYFLLPLIAIVLIAYAATTVGPATRWRPWRRIHFWFSVVYSVTNVPHLIADILVPDARLDQIVLMVALTVFGLLINVEAWRWWRQTP
jgi:hypothetical protein